MKKTRLLVLMLACLASTSLFAQHYTPDYNGCPAAFTKLIGVLTIDGVEQSDPELEIGAFDPEDICRGTIKGQVNPRTGKIIYQLRFKALETGTVMHFKVYDNTNNVELDLVDDLDEEITYQGNYTYQWNGSNSGAMNPYEINFTNPDAPTGYTLEIDAYTSDKDHYYLIASPVGAISASAVEGLRTPAFDLYSFNPSAELEWDNHRDEENFPLQPGVGYLYANNSGTDLVFTGGTPVEGDSYDVTFEHVDGEDFPGWNLIGNPFTVEAYPNVPFYTMNPETGEYIANGESDALLLMCGAFVYNGEASVTFTKAPANNGSKLALNLSNNGKVLDRAIVSFGQGQQLPKLQFRDNSSKLYIPMDGNDYALVRSEGIGEMPVSFKAETNGTYSLTLASENVSFAYLHLIDNLTGADQDLLANPSYSFSANTTDYASRFRLVFATGSDEENFAFFSNGSLFVNNEGNATLQIVDVTGRIIKCESINGCANVNINAASGVYMVRLVNGDNVKVQKVVK